MKKAYICKDSSNSLGLERMMIKMYTANWVEKLILQIQLQEWKSCWLESKEKIMVKEGIVVNA